MSRVAVEGIEQTVRAKTSEGGYEKNNYHGLIKATFGLGYLFCTSISLVSCVVIGAISHYSVYRDPRGGWHRRSICFPPVCLRASRERLSAPFLQQPLLLPKRPDPCPNLLRLMTQVSM